MLPIETVRINKLSCGFRRSMDWNFCAPVNQKAGAEKSTFTHLKIKSKGAVPTINVNGKFAKLRLSLLPCDGTNSN